MSSDLHYYEHIIVQGRPFERGYSHGQQAKDKILKNIGHYKKPGKLLPLEQCYQIIDEVYLPGIKLYFPEALEEMKGIADGAGVSLDDILLLNARYDLARVKSSTTPPCPGATRLPDSLLLKQNGNIARVNGNGVTHAEPCSNGKSLNDDDDEDVANECTSAAFLDSTTINGDVIAAQNWDMSAHLLWSDTVIYLEIRPDSSENLPVMFIVTEAGQLARSGMNSAGLGICANSLMCAEDYYPLNPDLPNGTQKPLLPMSLVRRLYLHTTSFADALIIIHNIPRHVSNNLTVATCEGFAMCLELTPGKTYRVYPEGDNGYVIHGNHFSSTGFEASGIKDRYPGGSSWFRPQRVERKIRPFACGKLDANRITAAFSDHLSKPSSVCQHPDKFDFKYVPDYPYKGANATVAHVVYNLTQRTITVCKGPPCEGKFMTYKI